MSVAQSQFYKDARAHVFHSSIVRPVGNADAAPTSACHTAPNVAAIASKTQMSPAARAAKTALWVGTLTSLEVYDVENSCKVAAEQSRFPLSRSHSRSSSSSVLTDSDIDDECSSLSTTETASPLRGCANPRKHGNALIAHHNWAACAETERDGAEQSITTEVEVDLAAAATLLCKNAKASTRQNSEVYASKNPSILNRHNSKSSCESSANLDFFAQEKEPLTCLVKGTAPWLNSNMSCCTADEEIPEEIY